MATFRLKADRIRLSENDVEKSCLDICRYRRYRPFRLQSGLFKTADNRWITIGEKGISDYIVAHEVYPAFLMEVKRPGLVASDDQTKFANLLWVGYRIPTAIIACVEDLVKFLKEHEMERK